jgi:hypothetical protein
MATDSLQGVEIESLTGLHWAGIALAAVTGGVHLWLFVAFAGTALGFSFLVAAAGFFAGIGAILLDYHRRTVYALGIPFTIGQIVLWYYVNFVAGSYAFPADVGGPGAVDKVAQVVLIAVLVALLR